MTNNGRSGKYLDGRGHDLLQILSRKLPCEIEESQETSANISGVLTDI
jgi:hypothetical protein